MIVKQKYQICENCAHALYDNDGDVYCEYQQEYVDEVDTEDGCEEGGFQPHPMLDLDFYLFQTDNWNNVDLGYIKN